MEKPRYKPELLAKLSSQLKEMKKDLLAIERQMCQYENSCIKASVKTGNVLSGWGHLDVQADSSEENLPSSRDESKQFKIEHLFSFSSPSTEKISREMIHEEQSVRKELENGGSVNSAPDPKTPKPRTSSSSSGRARKRPKH